MAVEISTLNIAPGHWAENGMPLWVKSRHISAKWRRKRECLLWAKSKHHYSITSSAREMIAGGTDKPIAFAAFKLTTNSNFVGSCTGSSAGLAPFRMRSTYD